MGVLSIREILQIIRKNLLRIVAFSLLVGVLTFLVASSLQTYTCVLGFKFNHPEAADGLAPDGSSKLDPYEIQNPVVIQGALDDLGYSNTQIDVKGIRQNLSINKVVTELDSEVSKSAALLGEKVESPATEFEMRLTYPHRLGEEFGTKMFSAIIKEYDAFLLENYYGKNSVSDFAKIVSDSSADYIDISNIMGDEIDDIVQRLYDLADRYPEFRSKNTGYSLDEVAALYDNLRAYQHAKYYGNVRAGNLAKDADLVIKSYSAQSKALEEARRVSSDISENYKSFITTFYDSYKAAGLYRQAENVQTNTDSSNNRDQDVLEDFDVAEHRNTYDTIVLNYVDQAISAADDGHQRDYYNKILTDYQNDKIDQATKDRLLAENTEILQEINALSAEYSDIANKTIDELYNQKVTADLQYLIAPEVTSDVPVNFITVFAVVLAFGMTIIVLLFMAFAKKFAKQQEMLNPQDTVPEDEKKFVDTSDLDELQTQLYSQYVNDFKEFYLVYQDMKATGSTEQNHMECFMRWKSPVLGMVSPSKIVGAAMKLDIFDDLNKWILDNACKDIARYSEKNGSYPVVHINCPRSALNGFTLNDAILNGVRAAKIPANTVCMEINGNDISDMLEEIMLIKNMGFSVCIDRFEDSDENAEIIGAIQPDYVKMSIDVLNGDILASNAEEFKRSAMDTTAYILNTIASCHEKHIKVCICGIESKEQEENISKMFNFDFKQGYYYSKPQPLVF